VARQLLLNQRIEHAPIAERDDCPVISAGKNRRIAESFGALIDQYSVQQRQ
jgi:hypothetical protein